MSETSPVLGLPFIQPAQAQKHVTHNEALRILDAITQLVVDDTPRTTPPAAPENGARFVIGTGGTGIWAGQDQKVTVFVDGAWHFFTPDIGWRADVAQTGETLRFDGGAWQTLNPIDTLTQVGVNTTADPVNRLAVAGDATLLTHTGAGHQVKVNKNTETDTASLLFQTGFSGRAEMGTAGSDDFAIKVSPDGSSFSTGLSVSADNGAVQIPQGQCFFDEITLASDTSWSRDIPFADPARILLWIGLDAPGHAYLVSITGTLVGAANFAALNITPADSLTFLSGPLGGTSGPDGALTLSIDTTAATPQLCVENRLGQEHLITFATLGR